MKKQNLFAFLILAAQSAMADDAGVSLSKMNEQEKADFQSFTPQEKAQVRAAQDTEYNYRKTQRRNPEDSARQWASNAAAGKIHEIKAAHPNTSTSKQKPARPGRR